MRKCAMLAGCGHFDGQQGQGGHGKEGSILGLSVSLSEAEAHWRAFREGLLKRGLCGVRQIISDNHAGLQSAHKAVFTGVPWRCCQFHLQQNAGAYVPRVSMRREVAENIRSIFNTPDQETAEAFLKRAVEKYSPLTPKLTDWNEVGEEWEYGRIYLGMDDS